LDDLKRDRDEWRGRAERLTERPWWRRLAGWNPDVVDQTTAEAASLNATPYDVLIITGVPRADGWNSTLSRPECQDLRALICPNIRTDLLDGWKRFARTPIGKPALLDAV
jgi:hypothetical protein